jgi:hypothetical protein
METFFLEIPTILENFSSWFRRSTQIHVIHSLILILFTHGFGGGG